MTLRIDRFFFGAVYGVIVLVVLLVGFLFDRANRPQPIGPERVYDTSFGSVACASEMRTHCGHLLWNCHDGATYSCLQNVRRREN